MATHSSTLAWKIPWMEEPGRLQSMKFQRVKHDLVTKQTNKTTQHRYIQINKHTNTHTHKLSGKYCHLPSFSQPSSLSPAFIQSKSLQSIFQATVDFLQNMKETYINHSHHLQEKGQTRGEEKDLGTTSTKIELMYQARA